LLKVKKEDKTDTDNDSYKRPLTFKKNKQGQNKRGKEITTNKRMTTNLSIINAYTSFI